MAKSMTKSKVADYLAGKLALPKKTAAAFLENSAPEKHRAGKRNQPEERGIVVDRARELHGWNSGAGVSGESAGASDQ